jgi:hypothetical protein
MLQVAPMTIAPHHHVPPGKTQPGWSWKAEADSFNTDKQRSPELAPKMQACEAPGRTLATTITERLAKLSSIETRFQ